MKLFIGLDVGTTAMKVALFDQQGRLLAVSTQEYDLLTPSVNFVEEAPEVYWDAFRKGLSELGGQYSFAADEEIALAISAQGETFFCMDKDGKPLRNAIVWMDNRAVEEAKELEEKFGNEMCYKVTGQVSFEPCWPASKILWIRKNEPEVFKKTDKFLLVEDYFIYRLTGRFATEGSLVCSSTYWDIINKTYWKEMLDFLQIKEEQLAPVMESGEVVGRILPEVSEELGLGRNVTVCTGALDQAAGAIGAGNIREGMFSENIGAALAICVPISKPVFDPARKMPLHYFALPDTYMIHTFTNGGMTLRWFRDKFCPVEMMIEEMQCGNAYYLIDEQVEKVAAGSDGLVMLPHLAGSLAPDVNSKAKGVWFGFTLQHNKAHFMRAIMESLGYVLRRNLDALKEMGIEVQEIRSLGGGSKSKVWNRIKADINNVTLETVKSVEAASLGVAILAGKAVGAFESIQAAVDSMVEVKERIPPCETNRKVYDEGYTLYKKLFNDLSGCFEKTL